MKKNYILLIVFSAFTHFIFGQSFLTVSPKDTFYVTKHPDSLLVAAFELTNTSANAVDVTWERNVLSAPSSWDLVVCDLAVCYAPLTKKATFNLAAGAKGKFLLDAVPNGVAGSAWVRITLTAKGLTTPIVIKYGFKASASVGVNESEIASKINITPNPVKDFFTLKGFDNSITAVQITDLTGRIVKKMNAFEGATYETSDLLKGTYFVSFLDRNNKRLTTKKMIKVD
jgi:hypothetical protein